MSRTKKVDTGIAINCPTPNSQKFILPDGSVSPAKLTPEANAARNILINGNMDIWQRATSEPGVANEQYVADRWVYRKVGSMVHTFQRSTDVPADANGSLYSLELLQTAPDDALAGSDFCAVEQRIEGYNMVGVPGKEITYSFWVKAGIIGDYILRTQRFGGGVIEDSIYTINVADTWEKKTITVAIPDDDSYNLDNQAALRVGFFLALTGSSMVNGVATGATSFKLSQVQMVIGDSAPDFRRAGRNIEDELAMCQRYYEVFSEATNNIFFTGQAFGATSLAGVIDYQTEKRADPTMTSSAATDFVASTAGGGPIATTGISFSRIGTKSVQVNMNTAGSLAAGDATVVVAGNVNAQINADSEL